MICKNCGQEILEGNAFCQNCGQPVEVNTAQDQSAAEVQNNTEESSKQYDTQAYTQTYDNTGYTGQAYDQSYSGQTYAEPVQPDGGKKKINPSVIALAAVVILAVIFLKSCFFGSNYKTPLDDMVKIINKKQTNVDKVVDAVIPAVLEDSYDEIIDVLKSNKEYKKDFKDFYDKDLPDSLEDMYDSIYDGLEDQYGKNPKISYKIEDKEKISKDERKAISNAYASFADLSSGVEDFIEAMEDCTKLTDKEIKKLTKQVEELEKKLSKFKVSSGYILDVEFTIKGKDDKDSNNMDIVVIKANGDWMIDYLSTVMINSTQNDLDEIEEMVDGLELKELNSQLKILAKYMKQLDEDMIEDALDNWDLDDLDGLFMYGM